MQECSDPKQEAKKLGLHPTLFVLGTSTNFKEAYLVCNGTVLCKVPLALAPWQHSTFSTYISLLAALIFIFS